MQDWREQVIEYPDDRVEWVEISYMNGETTYLVARCKHHTVVPVESCVTGEILAQLCTLCDAQLGAKWRSIGEHDESETSRQLSQFWSEYRSSD